jgi:hypothetical protein
MPFFNNVFGNHIFFENKKQKALNNINKQNQILKQIAAITQNIREKQRINAQYVKELQKNNIQMKSFSIKDKIINGVNSILLYFISNFITRQNNIHLRIQDTRTEINNSIKELEEKTKELLDIPDTDINSDSDTKSDAGTVNSEEILSEANKILSEPTQIINEQEQIINESEQIINEQEQIINEYEQEQIINEQEQIIQEPEPVKKKRSFISMLNKKRNTPL